MKTFILVRHGTTEWLDKKILHGISDVPLDEDGLRQAREAAQALKSVPASHLYSSPLLRCMQTAQAIGDQVHLQPVSMDNLIEMDFGWLEGKPFKDRESASPLARFFDRHFRDLIRIISGEHQSSVRRRVLAAWEIILAENKDEITIIVAHSGVLNQLLIHLFGKNFPKGERYYRIRPCAISEFTMSDDGQAHLVRLDDVSHLSDYQ